MNILRLDHAQITIPPGDEGRAREFYCGLLRLREIEKPEALRRRGGLWLKVGDQQVHIGVEDGVNRSASKAHLAYVVDDLNAWRSHLMDAGIIVEDGIAIPGHVRFEFRDPFGNRVEFIQPLAE